MQKFHQLAKDAQSNGDPVLAQNYLQHADHYLRRYNELSERKDSFIDKSKILEKNILNNNSLMIIHRHKKDKIKITKKVKILDTRNYGNSKVYFVS